MADVTNFEPGRMVPMPGGPVNAKNNSRRDYFKAPVVLTLLPAKRDREIKACEAAGLVESRTTVAGQGILGRQQLVSLW